VVVELVRSHGHDPQASTPAAFGGAPYRHFSDKDELLAAVAAQGMRDLRDAMTEAGRRGPTQSNPLSRLEQMLTAYLDTALARPELYRLIFDAELSRREFPGLVAEANAAYKLLQDTVTDAQNAGALPPSAPPLGISALLLSTTHGLVDLLISRHGIRDKGLDDPRTLIRLLLNSMPGPDEAQPAKHRRPHRR
jgi:AcrR family transcriptional regulator